MRKFIFIIFLLFFALPVFADVMPYYTNSIPKETIGMYQTGKDLKIYAEPSESAPLIKSFDFSYNPETMPDGLFGVLINEKQLGFLYVSDIGDDNWVEVIYNKLSGAKGWVQTEDKFQFLPWLSFYNMYGRKYGLRLMKDAPDETDVLHAKSDDQSQNMSKLRYVNQIRLTAVRGNWALVSVVDIDKTPKTGYMRWRNNDGTIYAFPNIK